MKVKSRIFIRKNDKNKLMKEINLIFGDTTNSIKDSKFEIIKYNDFSIICVDGKNLFFKPTTENKIPKYRNIGEKILPLLRGVIKFNLNYNLVKIDSGAIRFIVNGADVMCPGIVEADLNIQKGDSVIVIDSTYGKPLAIGIALVSGDSMKADSGKAVKSVHFVGDELWNLEN